jgi:hypothetical protein
MVFEYFEGYFQAFISAFLSVYWRFGGTFECARMDSWLLASFFYALADPSSWILDILSHLPVCFFISEGLLLNSICGLWGFVFYRSWASFFSLHFFDHF